MSHVTQHANESSNALEWRLALRDSLLLSNAQVSSVYICITYMCACANACVYSWRCVTRSPPFQRPGFLCVYIYTNAYVCARACVCVCVFTADVV